jgi:hypothetical protein
VNINICPTEDVLEQYVLRGQPDPAVDDHLLLCPVCQDTVQRLDGEIGEFKAALRTFGPIERRGGPQLERRRELRHVASKQVTVAASDGSIIRATLRDISRGGVSLIVENGLRVNDRVEITEGERRFTGLVRYCRECRDFLCAGVQLEQH